MTSTRSRPLLTSLLLLVGATLGVACSGLSDDTRESINNVTRLRFGSMSQLRERRDTGPFKVYSKAPKDMLDVLKRAASKAKGEGGHPVKAVFVSKRRLEVVAKEREPELASQEGYADQFVSAMLAVVHPVANNPQQCRVEIHAIRGGPFHRGVVQWERDMPRWIDEALRKQPAAPQGESDTTGSS